MRVEKQAEQRKPVKDPALATRNWLFLIAFPILQCTCCLPYGVDGKKPVINIWSLNIYEHPPH